jgi:hypothetical protein
MKITLVVEMFLSLKFEIALFGTVSLSSVGSYASVVKEEADEVMPDSLMNLFLLFVRCLEYLFYPSWNFAKEFQE